MKHEAATPPPANAQETLPSWAHEVIRLLRDTVVIDKKRGLDVTTDFFAVLPMILARHTLTATPPAPLAGTANAGELLAAATRAADVYFKKNREGLLEAMLRLGMAVDNAPAPSAAGPDRAFLKGRIAGLAEEFRDASNGWTPFDLADRILALLPPAPANPEELWRVQSRLREILSDLLVTYARTRKANEQLAIDRILQLLPPVPLEPLPARTEGAGDRVMSFPAHKCGLFLTHNEHRDYYQKLSDYLDEKKAFQNEPDWETPESRERAIATDECWVLQWYPETPISSFCIAAPTLEELLKFSESQSS